MVTARGYAPPADAAEHFSTSECTYFMEYESKAHANYFLPSHLIFVWKYRKKLLLSYGEEVKQIFEEIATKSDCSFEATCSGAGLYSLPGKKRTGEDEIRCRSYPHSAFYEKPSLSTESMKKPGRRRGEIALACAALLVLARC